MVDLLPSTTVSYYSQRIHESTNQQIGKSAKAKRLQIQKKVLILQTFWRRSVSH
jgi:hypothetical protein